MPAPAEIRKLVERFEANIDPYRGGGYNETLLRRDFLDPFFKALGWDIDNSQDYAEAFREVIHEDAIKVGGSTKAPDYSFRIGGRRIFFLEAKKPSVYIKEEIAPAYQLRRYAWYEIQDDVAYFEVFDQPKIIFPDIAKAPRFSLDNGGRYLANTAYCIGSDDLYLLGILNSRLFWFAISHISIPFGVRAGEYRYRLIYQYMEKVPIRVIDRKDKHDRARHDKLVALVEQMLKLHRDLAAAKTAHDKTLLERQIAATDKQIDRLAYELYGLTDEEIAVVEGGGAA